MNETYSRGLTRLTLIPRRKVLLEFETPQSSGIVTRRDVNVPKSIFNAVARGAQQETVEQLQHFLISTEPSLQSGGPSDWSLSFQVGPLEFRPLDAASLPDLLSQQTCYVRLSPRGPQLGKPRATPNSLPSSSSSLDVAQGANSSNLATRSSLDKDSCSAADEAVSVSVAPSMGASVSRSDDSSISTWDANPLRKIHRSSIQASEAASQSTAAISTDTAKASLVPVNIRKVESRSLTSTSSSVSMKDRNLNSDLFRRHDVNPLSKSRISPLSRSSGPGLPPPPSPPHMLEVDLNSSVTGIRPTESVASPTSTAEEDFGRHFAASYVKRKGDKESDAILEGIAR